ncbi:MAG TPA: type II toxin-antitoxin system VapC family toxin [Vicinamibacterales bacterium]|nr:type II toxin-antitoxin system VapC family toxin [Vicinamibacterales bacterium]
MKVLLDTNVIAELRKGARGNPKVVAWFATLDPDDLAISALTIGEIRRGIESVRRRDPKSAAALERWLHRVLTTHQDHILDVDVAVCEVWGQLNVPNPLPVIDGLLAATAKVHGLVLATRNVKDIARTGVEVINPFV